MCNGVAPSAGPPIALPLQQQVVQATPRAQPPASTAPSSGAQSLPVNPNLGRTVNLSA
ncbi:MAG TPA: hypothetical protein VLV50_12220 [Stellaceae bacterium]|nr:hypothetical protein [Stellaceae bacterium]